MLIVIVIIGILAWALIPRIGSARDKANDTARKAHLQWVATALISYTVDWHSLPWTGWECGDLQTVIANTLENYQYSQQLLPVDPNNVQVSLKTDGTLESIDSDSSNWHYLYCKLDNSHFALISVLSSNWNLSSMPAKGDGYTFSSMSSAITESETNKYYVYLQ